MSDIGERASKAPAAEEGGLPGRVMLEVNRFIRDHELAPGADLPGEAAFAERLGVSRPVTREAFRALSALKLIDVGNGRRPRVAPIDESVLSLVIDHAVNTKQVTVQQILDVRRTIEARTAFLAALRRSPREATRLTEIGAEMQASFASPERVMELDIAFHETIAQASRNPLFALLIASLKVITRATWLVGWNTRADDATRMESVAVHSHIAAAIAAANAEAAEARMAAHFALTSQALLRAGLT